MRNLMLAAAAVVAFGTGSALADGNVYAPPAQTSHATPSADHAVSTFASTTREETSVYPAFRSEGYTQGGNQ
jgi:hypothetical protein